MCPSQCSTAVTFRKGNSMVMMLPHKRCPKAAACMPLMLLCSPGSVVAPAWRAPAGQPSALQTLPPPHRGYSARPCRLTARAETGCPHAGRPVLGLGLMRAQRCDARPGLQAGRPSSPLRGRPWRAGPPAPPGMRTLRRAHEQHLLTGQLGKAWLMQTKGRLGSLLPSTSRVRAGDGSAPFSRHCQDSPLFLCFSKDDFQIALA